MSSIHIDKNSGDLKFYHDDGHVSIVARNKNSFKDLTLPLVLNSQYQSVYSKKEPLVVFPAASGHADGGSYQILIAPHTAPKLKISPKLNPDLESFSTNDYYLLNIKYNLGIFKTFGHKLSLQESSAPSLLKCRSAENTLSLIFDQDIYLDPNKQFLLTNTSSKIEKITTNDGSNKINIKLSDYINYNTELVIPENSIFNLAGDPLPAQIKNINLDYLLPEVSGRWIFDKSVPAEITDDISNNNLRQNNPLWQPGIYKSKYFDSITGKFTQHQYLSTGPNNSPINDFSFVWIGVINDFTQPYCNLFSANGLEKNKNISGWRLYLDGQNKSLNFSVGPSVVSIHNFNQLNQSLCIIGRHSEKFRDIHINGKQCGFQQNLVSPSASQTFSVDHLNGEILEIQVSNRVLENSEIAKIQEYFSDKMQE